MWVKLWKTQVLKSVAFLVYFNSNFVDKIMVIMVRFLPFKRAIMVTSKNESRDTKGHGRKSPWPFLMRKTPFRRQGRNGNKEI